MIAQRLETPNSEVAAVEKPVLPDGRRTPDDGPRLKILLVSHKFPPFIGGIEMHSFEVGRRMAAMGHSVTVLTGDPSDRLAREEMVSGMRILRVPTYPRSSDVFFAPGVYREVVRGTWDIIHVQGFHTFVPPIAMLGAIRKSAPFAITFHSGGHSSRVRNVIRGAQRAILRPLIVQADQLIAVSEFEADYFARGLRVARERIVVVPNGAEIETPFDVAPASQSNPLILTIGRLERYKGHQRVIAAFKELLKKRPGANLVVLGEGPYKAQLSALVQQLGLEGRVTIGGIPPENRRQMGRVLSRASAVVLLSDYEAHPVAALEAIALGRPVLASNSTGFAEMAAKGLLRGVDPTSSPQAIAEAIIEELERPPTSRRRVAINNWNDCAGALLAVYRETLRRRQAAGAPNTSRETNLGPVLTHEAKGAGS